MFVNKKNSQFKFHDGLLWLADIADIRRTFVERSGYATFNGRPTIGLAVTKRIGENILETSTGVRAIIDEVTSSWPDTVSVEITYDASKRIGDILTDLRSNIINAILLVMILVVAALGIRSALLVGIAIPASILIAFFFMHQLGMTANMMVMFALIVAVGMLVDGAIVVVEYADRKIAQGFDRKTAYGAAATRMFWPIISSTLTTLAAFLPLLLWPGITGDYMRFLPVTLILTLGASLLVAVFFLPTIASQLGRSSPDASRSVEDALDPLGDIEADRNATPSALETSYIGLLHWAVRHPFVIIGAAAAGLISVFVVYGANNHGQILISAEEPPGAQFLVSARGNLSPAASRDLVADVERAILETDGVHDVYSNAGPVIGADPFRDMPRDTIGEMYMNFVEWRGRRPVDEIFAEIRERLSELPGIHVEINPFVQSFNNDKDVVVELYSNDWDLLPEAVSIVSHRMEREMTGLIDIDNTVSLPGIDWVIEIDREQAQRFGANVLLVGGAVQLVTDGLKIGEYRPDDYDWEIDIRLRLDEASRGILQLDSLRFQTDMGLVPISNFVERVPRQQVTNMERRNGAWILKVRANVESGTLAYDKVNELKQWLTDEQPLPDGVWHRFGGEDRLQQESSGFLERAFLAALMLMAMILLTQFNSFYQSFLILSAVVMSTAGVLIGMLITSQPFSVILTGTGIIALAGIVVNNNIVLIDTYQRLLKAGTDQLDAIIQAGAQRLRPILLTTVTTMIGLMPMVVQFSFDPFSGTSSYGSPTSYTWRPMSNAIVFGLGFSTILTLIVTPAALAAPLHLAPLRSSVGSLSNTFASLRTRFTTHK